MRKRIFIGLALSEPLPDLLAEALHKLRVSAGKGGYRLTWTEPGNFHLTIKFIGETDRVGDVMRAIQGVVPGISPFELELHGFGAFPNEHEARVLWVGVRNKMNLRQLQEEVESACAGMGFPRDAREFNPHITLARVRSKQSVKDLLSPFVRRELGTASVSELVVFESVLGGPFPR